jgi:glutamate racemase
MTTSTPVPLAQRPIGVFDSGIGGLSILQALRTELPHEDVVYVADSAHAPYGERDEVLVRERALRITQDLIEQHHIKTLVVACNTATAVAIAQLRALYPELPIVGVEPALKPAAALSRTHRVGVLATRATLASAKYRALQTSLQDQAEFVDVPCDGLAAAIEADDAAEIERLSQLYLGTLGSLGTNTGEIDTVVLGCTHYPFASNTLKHHLASGVEFLESGAPVARQTRRLLEAAQLLNNDGGTLTAQATGADDSLRWALTHWRMA